MNVLPSSGQTETPMLPWYRKHAPKDFDELNLPEVWQYRFKQLANKVYLPHLFFHGPPGRGKTSAASLLQVMCTKGEEVAISRYDAIQPLSQCGLQGLREALSTRCLMADRRAVITIDDIDLHNARIQKGLSALMDSHDKYFSLLVTSNEKMKVNPAIVSRCEIYDFNEIGHVEVLATLRRIALLEGISPPSTWLNEIAGSVGGDVRQAIQRLEASAAQYRVGAS